MNQQNKVYNTALYLRLSREDAKDGESSSISSQRELLQKYARDNQLIVYDEYVDDGYSGMNFDRPEFVRMQEDILEGHVNCVIFKDFSRLGRNQIEMESLRQYFFPENNIRYIAVDDRYDSLYSDAGADISANFMITINSIYAADISRKIRSSLKARMEAGKLVAPLPRFGYRRDPLDNGHLIPDETSAAIVREIFSLAADGITPAAIAHDFNEREIPTPAMYLCQKNDHMSLDQRSKNKEWTSSIVCKMLKNEVYIGNLCQGRSRKVSLVSKKTRYLDKDEWIVTEGAHEPIIDKETFELVQKRVVSRRNEPKTGFKNIFAGIAKCADCGCAMSPTATRKKDEPYKLTCGKYKQYGAKKCSNHFISYNHLYDIVLSELKEWLALTEKQRIQIVLELAEEEAERAQAFEKKNAEKLRELQNQMNSTYLYTKNAHEQYSRGEMPKMLYDSLMQDYSKTAEELTIKIEELSKQMETDNSRSESYEKFFTLLDDVTNPKELTHKMLVSLIDRIEIGQGVWEVDGNGKKHMHQDIRIYYKFIGCTDEE